MTIGAMTVLASLAASFHLNPSALIEGDGSAARPFKTFAAVRKAVRAAWPVTAVVKRNDSRAMMTFQKNNYRPSPDAPCR